MDLSQVTLTQMRYAVSVSELGHFRLAAEQCSVSQSGLSMQVQKLEELLELTLFDRSKKPILVTDEGKRTLAQMRAVLRETERLGQLAQEEEEPNGTYRLGVIPTLSSTVIPLFLADFIDDYPEVDLIIEELTTNEIIARLQADTLDGGILATPLHVQGLDEEALGQERLVAYLPPGDPLIKRKSVKQEQLAERPLWVMPEGHCFRSQVLSFCARPAKKKPPVQFESGSFETLMRLVDQGIGATIIPAMVAARLPKRTQEAQVREFSGTVPVREIGLVSARADLRRRVREALVGNARLSLKRALSGHSKKQLVLDPLPD